MTTKTATFPLRLPVSLKAALETISDRDGTSINPLLDGSRMVMEMLHVRWNNLTGKYTADSAPAPGF